MHFQAALKYVIVWDKIEKVYFVMWKKIIYIYIYMCLIFVHRWWDRSLVRSMWFKRLVSSSISPSERIPASLWSTREWHHNSGLSPKRERVGRYANRWSLPENSQMVHYILYRRQMSGSNILSLLLMCVASIPALLYICVFYLCKV